MKNDSGLNKYFAKVFMWMFMGLAVTGIVGYLVAGSESAVEFVFANAFMPFLFFIIEIIIMFMMGSAVKKQNITGARILFILFSVINGLTFSSVFILYELGSIAYAFLAASLLFLILGFMGYATKRDVTKLGSILFASIIALIILEIISLLFFKDGSLDVVICFIGIVIFALYTLFDAKKLKDYYYLADGNQVALDSIAIFGALNFYLDFLNLFYYILDLIGNNSN